MFRHPCVRLSKNADAADGFFIHKMFDFFYLLQFILGVVEKAQKLMQQFMPVQQIPAKSPAAVGQMNFSIFLGGNQPFFPQIRDHFRSG